ncbi:MULTISPECIES: hypothetical protein [Corynebacterium]|uniref:hypothetical protein n=1 Tax=Corynebacterium TaxID=1716 RepID=UPI00124E7571|nr:MULTISPECIES: hypothetical protein [Corynebacterium]
MTLFHHKQPISAQGATYANSFTQTMKGQSLELLDMFTRETLQNSWDARDRSSDEDGVTFSIDYLDLDKAQGSLLTNEIFGVHTPGLPELEHALAHGSLSLLKVSDAGTLGLRGPTTAITSEDEAQDFVSFIRNIGRSADKQLAGGTYGFGKSVFFIASAVNTVLVYTRTTDSTGAPTSRFIAMANGDSFNYNGQPFTGRHWWGTRALQDTGNNSIEYAEPLVDHAADEVARRLGLDSHFSAERPRGTCVAVLNPSFEDSPIKGLREIAASLTRWAWPHMVNVETGLDPIEFHVTHNGEEVKIPNPTDDEALKHFIAMYKEALAATPDIPANSWDTNFYRQLTRLETENPSRKALGNLSVRFLDGPIEHSSTVLNKDVSCHIATMRRPRMVVEYYQGPTTLTGRPYCGVFVADDSADEVFARSEPAAHHEWNKETVKHDAAVVERFWGRKHRNNPVSIFFTRITKLLKRDDAGAGNPQTTHYRSMTNLSSELGAYIANTKGGTDTRRRRTPTRKPRRSAHPKGKRQQRVSYSAAVSSLSKQDHGILAQFRIEISIPTSCGTQSISVEPEVYSDTDALSTEGLIEAGLEAPTFIQWLEPSRSPDSLVLPPGNHVLIAEILQPENTAVGVQVYTDCVDEEETL